MPYDFMQTPSEILWLYYPENIPVIKRNLKQARRDYAVLERFAKEALELILESIYAENVGEGPYGEQFFVDVAISTFYKNPLKRIEERIRSLERLLTMYNWGFYRPGSTSGVSPGEIAVAKNMPLTTWLKTSNDGFALCPFHNEKTPSFKIYNKQNRWYCYGCSQGGDAIDFIQKQNSVDFPTAVKMILG